MYFCMEYILKYIQVPLGECHLSFSTVMLLYNVVIEGFKEAAEKFEQEAGISSPLKLNTLGNRIKVIEAVQSGKMQEAITLINQLYPGLLDDDRDLYFHLQVHIIFFLSNKIHFKLFPN